MKTYNETRVAFKLPKLKDGAQTVDEQGQPEFEIKQSVEADYNKKLEAYNKLVAENKATQKDHPGEHQKAATFVYHEAENDNDIMSLVPDEQERVNIFNRGYVLKQQRLVMDHTTDLEDAVGVDTAHDLQAEAAIKSERKKLTPQDKAMKSLLALNPDQLAAILAQFQQAQTA